MDGNNIKTVINNYGVIAQPGNIGPRLAWNGDHNTYLSDLCFMVGVQLPIQDYTGNGIPDTIYSVITPPVLRPGGTDTGVFEPVDSFYNHQNTNPLQGVALSHIPDSWPVYWPDHPEYGTGVWNGLYGPDIFVGDQEAYFLVDDANDHQMFTMYSFLPDSTNPSRKGQGIKVCVRYIQLNHPLFEDIFYKIYDIKNESIHNYTKVVFGELVGTYIGGEAPEFNDDVTLYYPHDNFIISYDFDQYVSPSVNPNWVGKPGYLGQSIISSPNDNTITSVEYFVPSDNISFLNDQNLWQRLRPGYFDFPSSVQFGPDSIPYALRGEDGDYIFGSGYFSLNSGETKRVVNAITFGNSKTETIIKAKRAEALFFSGFDTLAIHNSVMLTSFPYFITVSGNFNITWGSNFPNGKVEIWYSSDNGENWSNVVRNAPNTGQFVWNTLIVEDAAFAKIIIFIKDNDGNIFGFDESGCFKVNNPGNGSPYIKMLNEEIYSSTITSKEYDFNLLIGDPEDDPLLLKIYYSVDSDTNFYLSQSLSAASDTLPRLYTIDLNAMSNSDALRIKFEVTDGVNYHHDITSKFRKQVRRDVLSSNNVQVVSGYAQVPFEVRMVDANQITSNEYIISFNDTLYNDYKTFSVLNTRYGYYTIENAILYPGSETPVFDGLTLYTEDIITKLDEMKSRWSNPHPFNLSYHFSKFEAPNLHVYGRRDPFDYQLIFSDTYNDSSNFLNQVFGNVAPPARHNLNFKVFRIANGEKERIQFAFTEGSTFRPDTLSFLDQVILSNPGGTMVSWRIIFTGDSSSLVPAGVDTLFLFTEKGFSIYDTLRVFNLPVSVDDYNEPQLSFHLSQNFPNPFNPVTTIVYTIPSESLVQLQVFDILGREIKTLVNEEKPAGRFSVSFDASRLASGVYFYRIVAGDYVSTKKMLLVK